MKAGRPKLRDQLRARRDQGFDRVRSSIGPIIEAAVAATLSWVIAYYLLKHPAPFFAPVATWICLSFSNNRDIRLVSELAIGVTLGVAVGDMFVYFVGSGWIQIAFVMVIAACLGRFLDKGRLLATQAGVQGIIIVALPVHGPDPFGRWTDALVGGGMALLFAVLMPHDLRKPVRIAAARGFGELGAVLQNLADGMYAGDLAAVKRALGRGRRSQPAMDAWFTAANNATRLVRISPARRRLRPEVEGLRQAAEFADRAIRNARVVARRGTAMLEMTEGAQGIRRGEFADADDVSDVISARRLALAEVTMECAQAARVLSDAARKGRPLASVRDEVRLAGEGLTAELAGDHWQLHVYVLELRSMVVDMLQACGMSASSARAELPSIQGLSEPF